MGILDLYTTVHTRYNSVGLVAGYDVVNVGGVGGTHASRRSGASADVVRVHEDAVVDDGGDGGDCAGNGEPDGERQRDVGLPEEHAQPEGRSQRVAR